MNFNKLVDAIACAGGALEAGDRLFQEKRAMAEKIAAAMPAAVSAILDNGLVAREQLPALEATLQDPAKTLTLMTNMANTYGPLLKESAQPPVPRLGQPEPGKTSNSPYSSAADRAWYGTLLGTAPGDN